MTAFLDRALYLPKAWVQDLERREEAGIPPEVPFATKGDLAQTMLARAFAADVPAAWVTEDEIDSNDGICAAGWKPRSGRMSWPWRAPTRSGRTGCRSAPTPC